MDPYSGVGGSRAGGVEKGLHPKLAAPFVRHDWSSPRFRRSGAACSSATACLWAYLRTASYRRLRSWLY
jgi:hypothetical protein